MSDEILAAIAQLRSDLLARLDRMQNNAAVIRDEIAIDLGGVEAVRRDNEDMRSDLRQMREQMSVMWKQLKALEAKVREMRGEP